MQKILTKLLQLSTLINNKKKLIFNLIYRLFFISIFSLIIYFVYCFSKFHLIILDDTFEIFLNDENSIFYQLVLNVYHGRYIGNFLTKLIGSILPNLLSIHPNIFVQIWGGIIKGILLSAVCFTLAGFWQVFSKNSYVVPVIAFLCYIYYQYNFIGKYPDFLYTAFFGFTFPFIFLFLFLKQILFYSFEKNDFNLKLLYLYAFLTGISNEFNSITAFIFLVTYSTGYKKIFTNGIKPVLLSLLFLFSGIFIYFINPGLISAANDRGVLKYNFFDEIKEFIIGYKLVFYEHFVLSFVIILLLMLVINIFYKKFEYKKILYTVSLLTFSGFAFYFLLVFTGRAPNNTLYIYHLDLIMQLKLYLIMIIVILFSYISQRLPIFTFALISVVFLVISTFNPLNVLDEKWYLKNYLFKDSIKSYAIARQGKFYTIHYSDRYLLERIYAYYSYKNIPITILKNDSYNLPAIYFPYSELYLKSLYNNAPLVKADTNSLKSLYNIYLKDGGCEIPQSDIHNADFNNLLKDDFVLTCR